MNALATRTDTVKPANLMRGKGYQDHAVAFITDFPIGSSLTPERFDEWAHQHGYLSVPINAPKQSDVWLAHLQRRHQLRYNINRAATHPRMAEMNQPAYSIDNVGQKLWEVRAPHQALLENDTAKKLDGLATIQRRKLLYLMQSEDFAQLEPYLRMAVEDIRDEIQMTIQSTQLAAQQHERRIGLVKARIQAQLESGALRPRNGGIAALLAPDSEPNELPPVDEVSPEPHGE